MIDRMHVFGLAGNAGQGKDTVGRILGELLATEYGFVPTYGAFALPTKLTLIAESKGTWDYPALFGRKDAQVRRAIQQRAHEGGRETFGADCWVDAARSYVEFVAEGPCTDAVVFRDVRYPNEAAFVQSSWSLTAGGRVVPGGLLLVLSDRGGLTGPAAAHASEQVVGDIPPTMIDGIIYNERGTTPEDLRQQLRAILDARFTMEELPILPEPLQAEFSAVLDTFAKDAR